MTEFIGTLAAFLEERIDWLEVRAVPNWHDESKPGTDIVIRIDGTYFLDAEEGMVEYWAQRLESIVNAARWHAKQNAAAEIKRHREASNTPGVIELAPRRTGTVPAARRRGSF